LAAALKRVVTNTNVDTLPAEVFDKVLASMADRGISLSEMAALRRTAYGGITHYQFAPSHALIGEYASVLDDEELRRLADSDPLFWERIVEIAADGSELVFDLTVPGPASWFSKTVAAHNSGAIEQDSDVVMFIHRDDSDPEKKRDAEIIISKHRNGPTGSIRLNFEPSLTQFRNATRDVSMQ
jgi:replicative DNA helicase